MFPDPQGLCVDHLLTLSTQVSGDILHNPRPQKNHFFKCFRSIQSLSCVQLIVIPWTPAYQASLSITNSRSLLKFMSIESVHHPTILSYVNPLSSHLQSFPVSGSFQMSQLFLSGGQRIGVSTSTSVLQMNTQD